MYKKIIMILLFIFFITGCQTNDLDSEGNNEKAPTTMKEETTVEKGLPVNTDKDSSSNDSNKTKDGLLSVHYINVGQGDATLFQYADKKQEYTILYDTGDWLGNEVVPYLEAQGITKLDVIIISHPHADHIGQLSRVMQRFDVGEVWMSGNQSNSNAFKEALETVLASEANYEEPRAGDIYDVGPLQLTVLHPAELTGELNEDSLSIHLRYEDVSFLFTGDASTKEELLMLENNGNLEADFLQLGHHGSNTSSGERFIEEIDPSYAIYSAGIDNSYGHPHEEVVSLFKKMGIPLNGTDIFGTIVVVSDGVTAELSTEFEAKENSNPEKPLPEEQHEEHQEKTEGCIDINNASKSELTEIKHIGDARAEEIITLRPFTSIAELTKINGIGDARLNEIKKENKACIGGNDS